MVIDVEFYRDFIKEQTKNLKITPSRMKKILGEYGTIENYLEIRNKKMAFEDINNLFLVKMGIKSMSDLEQYTKKDLEFFDINLGTIERFKKKYGILFLEDDRESKLSEDGSVLSMGFNIRVNEILVKNNILTANDLLNISEQELESLLYDKIRNSSKIGYVSMKKVIQKKRELDLAFGSTELENLRDKKTKLTKESNTLEEQTEEAKKILTSYENLAKGTTQAEDCSLDFKDE